MKKYFSLLLTIIVAAVFILNFVGCQKYVDNLTANSHLQKGNKYYKDEKYKKAIEEYKEALNLYIASGNNKEIKLAYIYYGTSCSMSYKPGLQQPDYEGVKLELDFFIDETVELKEKLAGIQDQESKEAETLKSEIRHNEQLVENFFNITENYVKAKLESDTSALDPAYLEFLKKSTSERMESYVQDKAHIINLATELANSAPVRNKPYLESVKKIIDLKGQIKEASNFIDDFKNSNTEFVAKTKENEELIQKIHELDKETKKLEGYGNYSNKIKANKELEVKIKAIDNFGDKFAEKEALEKQLADDETFIKDNKRKRSMRKEVDEKKKSVEDITKQLATVNKYIENMGGKAAFDKLTPKKEEYVSDIKINQGLIDEFKSTQGYIEIDNVVKEHEAKIKENKDYFKTLANYSEYEAKQKTRNDLTKELKSRLTYNEKIVNNENYKITAIKYLTIARKNSEQTLDEIRVKIENSLGTSVTEQMKTEIAQKLEEKYEARKKKAVEELRANAEEGAEEETIQTAINTKTESIDKEKAAEVEEIFKAELAKKLNESNDEILKKEYKDVADKNQKTILALSDIYDKIANSNPDENIKDTYYRKAESCYKNIMAKDAGNPKSFYILADFYKKYGKLKEAEKMYQERIELEPNNPEGYFYYANYLQSSRNWDSALKFHEKRVNLLLDPKIEEINAEADVIAERKEKVDKINSFLKILKKNRRLPKAEKSRILGEKAEQLTALKADTVEEELAAKIKERDDYKASVIEKLLAENTELSKEDAEKLAAKKRKIAEAYYTIGVVCWNQSYQTQTGLMGKSEEESRENRANVIKKGFETLEMSTKFDPKYAEPWAYKGLLWKQQTRVAPANRTKHEAEYKTAIDKFQKIRKRIMEEQAMAEKQKEEAGL